MASADGTIVIEDARIMYRNFAGQERNVQRRG
jgi:hypothetical protein